MADERESNTKRRARENREQQARSDEHAKMCDPATWRTTLDKPLNLPPVPVVFTPPPPPVPASPPRNFFRSEMVEAWALPPTRSVMDWSARAQQLRTEHSTAAPPEDDQPKHGPRGPRMR
jgi:hypothetical protein